MYPLASVEPNAHDMLGMKLHHVGEDDVHHYIERVVAENKQALILNLNIHAVNLGLKNEWYRNFVNSGQMVFCDGDGVRWGLRCLGINPPPKVTYNVWMWNLGAFCQQKGFSLYFLGGMPGVAQKAKERMLMRFPNLKILGARDGYFQKTGPETEQVIEDINRLKPDILIVGFGMPIQEKWIQEYHSKLFVHIFCNGGAAFDFISGRVKRAPEWIIKAEMEWIYRLYQEPRRLFKRYIVGNPYFFFHILKEKIKRLFCAHRE